MRLQERERSEPSTITLKPSLATLLGGLALALAALTFGALPLLVAGVGFTLLGVLTPAWIVLCARSAHVRRHMRERRIVEDDPLEVTIEVTRGRLGLPGAEIRDPLAGASVPLSEPLSTVSGGRTVELRIVTRAHRRGRHAIAPPSLTVTDALGLALIVKAGSGAADELLVLPRTEPVRWLSHERQRPAEGRIPPLLREPLGSGEIDGLRPYVPGAPASRIHWPALARGAGLLERRLVSEPQAQPLVVLDAREDPGSTTGASLDAAVRATASITLELARAGGCSILLPGARAPIRVSSDMVAWPGVHTRLALVQGEDRAPAVQRGAGGLIILVAARLDEPATAAVRRSPGSFVLVVPAELGEQLSLRASFEVSGCAGYVLATRSTRTRSTRTRSTRTRGWAP
ncbi:MAG: DUF58 domain-containing protein [Solirubrobacteraceae bacterium]